MTCTARRSAHVAIAALVVGSCASLPTAAGQQPPVPPEPAAKLVAELESPAAKTRLAALAELCTRGEAGAPILAKLPKLAADEEYTVRRAVPYAWVCLAPEGKALRPFPAPKNIPPVTKYELMIKTRGEPYYVPMSDYRGGAVPPAGTKSEGKYFIITPTEATQPPDYYRIARAAAKRLAKILDTEWSRPTEQAGESTRAEQVLKIVRNMPFETRPAVIPVVIKHALDPKSANRKQAFMCTSFYFNSSYHLMAKFPILKRGTEEQRAKIIESFSSPASNSYPAEKSCCKEFIPELKKYLKDPDEVVRAWAAICLISNGESEEAVPVLFACSESAVVKYQPPVSKTSTSPMRLLRFPLHLERRRGKQIARIGELAKKYANSDDTTQRLLAQDLMTQVAKAGKGRAP